MLDTHQRPRRPARETVARLEARIRAIEGRRWLDDRSAAPPPAVPEEVGSGKGTWSLFRSHGVVHEWFGLELFGALRSGLRPHTRSGGYAADSIGRCALRQTAAAPWIPPMGVLMQLALRRLDEAPGAVVWIGRRLWPYLVPGGREGDACLLERSVFVDPPDEGSRLWAIDLAIRSAAVTAVIADGSGLDLARTRRLQLAAENSSALVLVARPPDERDRLSAASMRWLVRAAPSSGTTPRWIVELLRCKGMQLRISREELSEQDTWMVEWQRVESGFAVSAALCDRSRRASLPGPTARKKTA